MWNSFWVNSGYFWGNNCIFIKIWSFLVIFGHFWSFVVIFEVKIVFSWKFGHFWSFLVIFGHLWSFLIWKFHSYKIWSSFLIIFKVKIQLFDGCDDEKCSIWFITWNYLDCKYNSAKFTHLWLDFWVDFFWIFVLVMFMPRKHQKLIQKPFNFDQNIHFMHTKIKNQNSWGIVSMQKLIMALVVINRLKMFQMCPILESLGLFNFHDGSQKISKIFKNLHESSKKISKKSQKTHTIIFSKLFIRHAQVPILLRWTYTNVRNTIMAHH